MSNGTDVSDPDLLVCIVECGPVAWVDAERAHPSVSLARTLHDLAVFLNAFRALQASNRLVVIASHPVRNDVLFSDLAPTNVEPAMAHSILDRIRSLPTTGLSEAASLLSGAMSLAMCIVRRLQADQRNLHARLLVVHTGRDAPAQYTSTMNCIFSAQKLTVPVDAVVLGASDSLLMQQASHLTGGVYNRVGDPGADLLAVLFTLFLPGAFDRTVLAMPHQSQIDYRATCFCHRTVQNTGYTCPVCLSVFCKPELSCPTCRTRFPRMPRRARAPFASTPAPS
ncbi:General transcription and DNA repair factor IIH subunit TFB4 [Plasmodiophora brassicae]|uniref:General transcription and DNA repair factor IIH subunit TFB4 n=1 Tax=Plasmodiophora brassicae TaxID=37360 RepID=A0A0G4IZR3_PLABS|nr:hypothetical protein PBRA_008112 [Plasmodiophora brassicae]SPQ99406.1 unnamed protein product [Plasmodiophora brassicae]